MSRVIVFCVSILFLSSCYYDNREELYPVDPNACVTDNLVYNGQMDVIFNTSCALSGCHVAGVQLLDLSTYEGVNANLERIKVRAVIEKTMPQAGPLSTCDQDKISQWIADGALEN